MERAAAELGHRPFVLDERARATLAGFVEQPGHACRREQFVRVALADGAGQHEDVGSRHLLHELLDRLLERPEHASRTSLRFACSRMRDHNVLDRVPDISEQAPHEPGVVGLPQRLLVMK